MGTILFKGIWTYTLPILYIAAFSITVLLSCGKSATGSRESAIFYVPSQFATIQEAIDGSADGDLVLIASGTYSGNGNRDIDFGGKRITLRSQDGPGTVIIDCNGSPDDPHRAFIFTHKEDSNSVVDGLTVRGGFGSVEWGDNKGGAIYCETSSPKIINCVFRENYGSHSGGAIACTGSSIIIQNCEFSGNIAEHGGAVYLDGTFRSDYREPAAPRIISCIFYDNQASSADGFGGAIYIQYFNIHLTLENSVFYDNSAQTGAGFAGGFNSLATISNCTFTANTGLVSSAIHLHGNRTDTLQNTILAFNNRGYAMSCVLINDLTISNCNIYNNQGGDWVGCATGYYMKYGNIWQDPEFCAADKADFHISGSSPCAPENNGAGILIGALETGCLPEGAKIAP